MGKSLKDFESNAPFAGDYRAALAAAQERLSRLQLAQIVHGRRAVLLLEGWEGSGRRDALKLIAGSLDPCHMTVHCADGPEFDDGRHWLAPYWSRLPRAGETVAFYGSWYRRHVEARAAGDLADKAWARAFDEINEFEAQQTDAGTPIVKLFFHVTAEAQAARLRQRCEDPWLRHVLGSGAVHSQNAREAYLAAWKEMFARSDTRWAGWKVIDAGDDHSARIAALSTVADTLEKALPAMPPVIEENVVPFAQERPPEQRYFIQA